MMANEIDKKFSKVYRYSREQMKRPFPKFDLQTGDICAYLENGAKKRELRKWIREAKKECSLVGFIGGPPCPDFLSRVSRLVQRGRMEDCRRFTLT